MKTISFLSNLEVIGENIIKINTKSKKYTYKPMKNTKEQTKLTKIYCIAPDISSILVN